MTTIHPETLERRVRVRPDKRPPGAATVSVVIPNYNYAHYLPQAVESVLGQQGVDVDVIIVDDASTDDSVAVARGMASLDSRIAVISRECNGGPVATFNQGLGEARGEFLVRLDADDILTPGSLVRSVALARAFPSVGLIYGHPLHFRGEKPPIARQRVRSWTVWPGREWLAARCQSGLNVITSPEVLMRRRVVDEVGGQAPLAHTHDMEMWLRMAAFSDVGHIEGADQAWHRDHAASLSAREVDPLVDLLGRRDAFEVLFSGKASTIPEARSLLAEAHLAIAREALDAGCHAFDRGRAHEAYISALIDLAMNVDPAVTTSAGWRALERRQRLGQGSVSRRPWYVFRAIQRRLKGEWRYLHWSRNGV